jgi:hypothetical protein
LYYFVGLAVSRFGSLIIEPLLKRFSFVRFAAYKLVAQTAAVAVCGFSGRMTLHYLKIGIILIKITSPPPVPPDKRRGPQNRWSD